MEDQVQRLVNKAWKRFQEAPQDQRFMIAISGIPGSGKTTLSQTVTTALNSIHQSQHPGSKPVAAFCPMDGYHLTRAQLSAMPDPTNAHARRGAEFTFDGPAFLALVKALRAPLPAATAENSDEEEGDDKSTIYAPSFDHAVKDPKDNDIPLRRHHRIVVFEGNYVCLDKEPWREAAGLMDERWFVEVGFDVARRRLIKRHVKAGIAADEVQAGKRADENDLLNGREIVDNKVQIDEVVVSREDEAWKHE